MVKKYSIFLFAAFLLQSVAAQRMVLKKGVILDSLSVSDSIQHGTFSLYLPKDFKTNKEWPLLMVMDLKGRSKQTLSMFLNASEEEGYILAAPRVADSTSITNNMVSVNRTFQKIREIIPIQKSRVYSAGVSNAARFASLVPIFIKDVKGVISIGAPIANTELLDVKKPFHYIGIVGKNNFNYVKMLNAERILDRFRFPNQILLHDGKVDWPEASYLQKSLQLFNIAAMGKKFIPLDSMYVQSAYEEDLAKVNTFKNSGKLLMAEQYMAEMMSMYGAVKNLDSLRQVQKLLRKDKVFRAMKRSENAAFLKESLLKEDYRYYMDEDVITHNFNNLGWWNYQMDEINKYISGANIREKEMGNRLLGFVNALAEDTIALEKSEPMIDEDALAFLYMLKTILEPKNFDFYLQLVSLSSKNEDYGTSLFYLEEAFKNGLTDIDRVYSLENTALLRIDPKFNKLISTYFKEARYKIIEE